MGNEYRDALQAAQRRIEVLERELELARSGIVRPAVSYAWVWLAVPLCFVMGLGALSFLVVRSRGAEASAPEPLLEPTPAPVTPPLSYGVTFYTGSGSRPQLVDVDGDGRKEIVSLFWGKGEERPLHVGVLDRDTLAVKWMRGPYPSQWSGAHTHLEIVGSRVVVTDSRETIHVLDLKSGETLQTIPLPGGARAACALSGSQTEVALQIDWEKWQVVDVTAGSLRAPKKGEDVSCKSPYQPCDAKTPANSLCIDDDPLARTRAKTPGFSTYSSSEVLGDTRFVTGQTKAKDGSSSEILLVLDRKTKARRWESPSILEGDTLHIGGHTNHSLTASSVVSFYQTSLGEFRLVARDTHTGNETWKTKVSGAQEGSYAGNLFIEDGDVFLFVDHGLHIVDLETGRERRTVTWL